MALNSFRNRFLLQTKHKTEGKTLEQRLLKEFMAIGKNFCESVKCNIGWLCTQAFNYKLYYDEEM